MKRKFKKKTEYRGCIYCDAFVPEGRDLMLCTWCYDQHCKELEKL